VYTYNFPEDRRPIKLLGKRIPILSREFCPVMLFIVYSVFLLETLQTALSGADLYYWFASGFGDMNHLASPYASPFDSPIMGSMVALCVQIFFVYRIWVLGKRATWWLCVLICLVVLLLVWALELPHNYSSAQLSARQQRSWGVSTRVYPVLLHTNNGSYPADAYPWEVCPWTGAESPCNGKVSK
jgi:hypothetical protein